MQQRQLGTRLTLPFSNEIFVSPIRRPHCVYSALRRDCQSSIASSLKLAIRVMRFSDVRRTPARSAVELPLRIVLDMRAQLRNRSKAHGSMRELRFDGTVGIERIG